MDRFALDRALNLYSQECPDLADRAAGALDRLLAGVAASVWPDVAWRFSPLTSDGYPMEFAFTSTGEAIRYVTEIAGPESDPAARLGRAIALIAELSESVRTMRIGGSPSALRAALSTPELQRLHDIQSSSRLEYGAWVSGRHGPEGDAFKLYVEVPRFGSPTAERWASQFLGDQPLLLDRSAKLRMIGLDMTAGRVEFYFRADGMQTWEVSRLMGLFGLTPQIDGLLQLVEDVTEQSTDSRLPGDQTGFSLSVESGGPSTIFSIFWLARNLLGGDGQIRRRLLAVSRRHNWPLRHYDSVSALLAHREGPQTRHGILSFIAGSAIPPLLHVGLRPP